MRNFAETKADLVTFTQYVVLRTPVAFGSLNELYVTPALGVLRAKRVK